MIDKRAAGADFLGPPSRLRLAASDTGAYVLER